jgi:hypothetical protein
LKLFLNFKDYIILIQSNEEKLLKKLEAEFHFFKAEPFEKIDLIIELISDHGPDIPSMVATKILEACTIYEFAGRRYQDYQGKALIIKEMEESLIQIFSQDEERMFELAFLTIHSYLGMGLDKKGYSRIHALGYSINNIKTVIMLPSKGGKSTLLKHLIEHENLKILSDDMPLISLNGDIHAFPTKISLDQKPDKGILSKLHWEIFNRTLYPPKYVTSLSQLKDKIDNTEKSDKQILIYGLRLSNGKSILTKVKKWKMIKPLLENMIIGIGLPQIIENILTFKFFDFFRLFGFGIMRSICAFQLLMKSNCYHFYMGTDVDQNVQLLLQISDEEIIY